MNRQETDLEIAELCRGLAQLFHAGVSAGDGFGLLSEDEPDPARRQWLASLARRADEGVPLSEVLSESGRFPAYVTGLLAVGERSGRTEEALYALAAYYDHRSRTEEQIRFALTYPSILLLLMLVVIVILLVRVLPVFEQVYASLGGQLTGVAGGLLTLGKLLNAAMPLLCLLLAAALAFLAAFFYWDGFRARLLRLWRVRRGDRGVSRRMNDARFAQSLSLGLRSGLSMEEALKMTAGLTDVPAAAERCEDCCRRLESGEELFPALRASAVLPLSACRLLSLGVRSGNADAVMEEIAIRLSQDADAALERQTARIEPALVLFTSLLVGVILLSVMLPLMHIMAAIG